MIRAFQEFYKWMMSHNIDPDHFEIVIRVKTPEAAASLRHYLNMDFNSYSISPAENHLPLDCGQISGLAFRIEDIMNKGDRSALQSSLG